MSQVVRTANGGRRIWSFDATNHSPAWSPTGSRCVLAAAASNADFCNSCVEPPVTSAARAPHQLVASRCFSAPYPPADVSDNCP